MNTIEEANIPKSYAEMSRLAAERAKPKVNSSLKTFADFANNSKEENKPIDESVLRDVIRGNLRGTISATYIYVTRGQLPRLVRDSEQRKLYALDYYDDGWVRVYGDLKNAVIHLSLAFTKGKSRDHINSNAASRFLIFQRNNPVSKEPERIYIAKSVVEESEVIVDLELLSQECDSSWVE
jgi:hypothetical protein